MQEQNINTTREGIEVKPGQVWRDLDKRTIDDTGEPRTMTVVAVFGGKASMVSVLKNRHGKPYTSTLSIKRMHKSATGWALVSESVA